MVGLFGRNTTGTSTQPEHLACIRVAIVGSSGVGKSTLAQFIAHESVGKPPKSTAGCDVVVKLVQHGGSEGGTAASHQQYFVELWDISGHKRYKDVRRLYYRHLNGIIFVHDLTDRASYTALTKWAAEVASEGSFVAPSQEDQASRNLGGLPVPVLLVGTKADMLKDGGSASGTSSPSSSSSGWGSAARHLRRRSWNGKVGVSELEAGGQPSQGLRVSARLAEVDMPSVLAFFNNLLARRYQPQSGQAWSIPPVPSAPAAGLQAREEDSPYGPSSQRLDDDWV